MWEVAGSIIGQMLAQGEYDKIARLRQESMERYGNTSLSSLEALAKEQQGPSKLGGVSMDPKYKAAQDRALQKLMGVSDAEGFDPQSVAKLNAAKQSAFGVERGMRGAAEQSLARRGQMDSGAAVSSAMGAAQGGIDRAYQGSINAAGDASERALQALMAGGSMARGMGQADLEQKNRVAGADDRINEFNLRNRASNEQELFDAKMRKLAGMNGVAGLQAGDAAGAAERTQSTARGLGKAAGTAYDYYNTGSDNQITGESTSGTTDEFGNYHPNDKRKLDDGEK